MAQADESGWRKFAQPCYPRELSFREYDRFVYEVYDATLDPDEKPHDIAESGVFVVSADEIAERVDQLDDKITITAARFSEQTEEPTATAAATEQDTSAASDADGPDDKMTTIGPPMQEIAAMATEDIDPDEVGQLSNSKLAYWTWNLIQRTDRWRFLSRQPDGQLFYYDQDRRVWVADGAETRLKTAGRELLTDLYSQNVGSELVEQVRVTPATQIDKDQLGAPEGAIAVANGLLDLAKHGEDPAEAVEELRPDHYALNRLNVAYDPDADCPKFKDHLESWARPEDIAKLQEYAGYLLHHWGQPFKKAIVLLGPRDSGKSTVLRVFREMLGEDNVASETLYDLMSTRWGPANLYNAIVNIRNELSSNELRNPERFKEITGGSEQISAERKGEQKFDFVVTQKFMFSSNEVPSIQGAQDAFYDRWLFARFPDTIPKEDQQGDYHNELLDELPGILNWALEGYQRLQAQGHFSNERTLQEKKDLWSEHGDSIDRFVQECIEVTGNSRDAIAKDDVYAVYSAFCDYIHKDPDGRRKLTRELKNVGGISDKEQNGTRYYTGLELTKTNIGGRDPLKDGQQGLA